VIDGIAAVVRMLEYGWPQKFSPEMALLYIEGLADTDPDAAQRAVRRLIRTSEFRPSVAAVRREIASEALPGLAEALTQAEQWLRYRDAQQYVNGSGYKPVRPEVHAAVRQACAALPGLVPRWQERFTAAWRDSSRKEIEGV
jgi:hypothetical protein